MGGKSSKKKDQNQPPSDASKAGDSKPSSPFSPLANIPLVGKLPDSLGSITKEDLSDAATKLQADFDKAQKSGVSQVEAVVISAVEIVAEKINKASADDSVVKNLDQAQAEPAATESASNTVAPAAAEATSQEPSSAAPSPDVETVAAPQVTGHVSENADESAPQLEALLNSSTEVTPSPVSEQPTESGSPEVPLSVPTERRESQVPQLLEEVTAQSLATNETQSAPEETTTTEEEPQTQRPAEPSQPEQTSQPTSDDEVAPSSDFTPTTVAAVEEQSSVAAQLIEDTVLEADSLTAIADPKPKTPTEPQVLNVAEETSPQQAHAQKDDTQSDLVATENSAVSSPATESSSNDSAEQAAPVEAKPQEPSANVDIGAEPQLVGSLEEAIAEPSLPQNDEAKQGSAASSLESSQDSSVESPIDTQAEIVPQSGQEIPTATENVLPETPSSDSFPSERRESQVPALLEEVSAESLAAVGKVENSPANDLNNTNSSADHLNSGDAANAGFSVMSPSEPVASFLPELQVESSTETSDASKSASSGQAAQETMQEMQVEDYSAPTSAPSSEEQAAIVSSAVAEQTLLDGQVPSTPA